MAEDFDTKAFVRDRREAMVSWDYQTIHDFCVKYQSAAKDLTEQDPRFWIAIHMARTNMVDLPIDDRLMSTWWLMQRGYTRSLPAGMDKMIEAWVSRHPELATKITQKDWLEAVRNDNR